MNPSQLVESIPSQAENKKLLGIKTGILICTLIIGSLLQYEMTTKVIQLVFEGLINSVFIAATFALAIIMCGSLLIFIESKIPMKILNAPIEWAQSFCLLPKYLSFVILICLPIFDGELINGVSKYYVQLFCIALVLELPGVLINLKAWKERSDFKKLNAAIIYEISKATIWAVIVYDIIGGFLFTSPSEKLISLGNILTDVHMGSMEKIISVLSCVILIAALERHFRPKWE